ncbi:MAG: hypothetical protein IPN29_03435 [Saprospiraceae bacterium]|nr:hypothetical protein [Saprospiraceae bacterium]
MAIIQDYSINYGFVLPFCGMTKNIGATEHRNECRKELSQWLNLGMNWAPLRTA